MELSEDGAAIGFPPCLGGNVEDWHLLLQGVDIHVEDAGTVFRFALRWYPRDIAVHHENDICGLDTLLDTVSQS